MADFGVMDEGHPDEVVLPGSYAVAPGNEMPTGVASGPSTSGTSRQMQPPAKTPSTRSGPNGPPPRQPPQTPNQNYSNRPGPQHQNRPQPNGRPQQVSAAQTNGQVQAPPANGNGETPAPAMFFSARSVPRVAENAPPGSASMVPNSDMIFNPKAESPSIRKTPGIDHSSSKPVGKNRQHVSPVITGDEPSSSQRPNGIGPGSTSGPSRTNPGNVVNPALNQTRQIGMPGSHSPMANRGQYRRPTIKRPALDAADNGARNALAEVTNTGNAAATAAGSDAKRQKMD